MSVTNDTLELVPRAYQEEIFQRAMHENVIAALETGSGKTLIAALLIKWVMAQSSSVGKKTIFLVPKVPLVDQQQSFLSEQTPLSVRGYSGSMGVEAWDKGKWALEFAEADCLVMTAQIFKDILVHGYWSMDRVTLLVFDECHHAQKNHPYRMLMVDHYDSCTEKPKVFGMTASPVWNSKKPSTSIQSLQTNLSSKVFAVRQHTSSLGQHVNRPKEIALRFSSSTGGHYISYYSPTLWEQFQYDKLVGMDIRALQGRYHFTFDAVGPAGADYFLLSYAKKVLEGEESPSGLISPPLSPRKRGSYVKSVSSSLERKKEAFGKHSTARFQNAVSAFYSRLISDRRALPSEWISPKLRAAVDVLVKHRSDTFQGIIFVSQRQLVMVLSWMFGRIAETRDWIRCGELTGHGDSLGGSEGVKGMGISAQQDVVQAFKAGKLNLLISTSVGEEGLDFPACELVIRYDCVQHMVGYVQSRGRARQQKSTYVVMIDEANTEEIARYERFRRAEPELKAVYQSMNASEGSDSESDSKPETEETDVDSLDLASRESYIIPSTGATLTYSSAIQLLNHLCSLIPRDAYTRPFHPKYSGTFQATVHLPHALPLPADKLTFRGPLKRTIREAKRAVAFMAVRELHLLGVFDDHLSPITSRKGESIEDADGKPIGKISEVAVMMDVLVASPWKAGPPWYLSLLYIEGRDQPSAGLLCGNVLPAVDLVVRGVQVQVRSHPSSSPPYDFIPGQLDQLKRFTKMGIRWCITNSPTLLPLACLLVPLAPDGSIDWSAIEKAVEHEKGMNDWSKTTENDGGKVLCMNDRKFGHPLRFQRFRPDLSLDSKPHLDDLSETFNSFADYFEYRYPIRAKSPHMIALFAPPAGRIIEVSEISRFPSSSYELGGFPMNSRNGSSYKPGLTHILPESFCRHIALSTDIIDTLQIFAPVCQRICDVFRARIARRLLNLPAIPDDLMIEALTLPCAMEKFNNQRLETIGDSVLKLSVVVYVYNRFPTKHEGQLSAIKSNSISNRLLLARAKAVKLERFLSCEPRNLRSWQFLIPDDIEGGTWRVDGETVAVVRRSFPRRSLQDCMEALLGAAYVTGGIDMALQTGTALGLCFGGSTPWHERYPLAEAAPTAALFGTLQGELQYAFRNGNLLVEAVKHPSFDSDEEGFCYQRLEFLGDAVVELVVTTYLYKKFPDATSGQISQARARAICNATLAALAVKRLSLHKYILANNVQLTADINLEVQELLETPYDDVVTNYWKFDPPKALADVFESVIGAVFVDCGFRYDVVSPIIETVMGDVLKLLHPKIPFDPVSRLLQWVAKAGCTKARFRRVQSDPSVTRKDSVAVLIHDRIVAGPIISSNRPLAKGLVAEEAFKVLSDDSSEFALHKVCECMRVDVGDNEEGEPEDLPERDIREKDIELETTEGFALAGRVRLAEVKQEDEKAGEQSIATDDELEELERQEVVEMLLSTPSPILSRLADMDCPQ